MRVTGKIPILGRIEMGLMRGQSALLPGEATMSPTEVVAYLEKLPSIAWPYGLVVAAQENGLRAPGDDAPIKRNKEELIRLLEKAGIKVDLGPSA
jgi:hypothetical protein